MLRKLTSVAISWVSRNLDRSESRRTVAVTTNGIEETGRGSMTQGGWTRPVSISRLIDHAEFCFDQLQDGNGQVTVVCRWEIIDEHGRGRIHDVPAFRQGIYSHGLQQQAIERSNPVVKDIRSPVANALVSYLETGDCTELVMLTDYLQERFPFARVR